MNTITTATGTPLSIYDIQHRADQHKKRKQQQEAEMDRQVKLYSLREGHYNLVRQFPERAAEEIIGLRYRLNTKMVEKARPILRKIKPTHTLYEVEKIIQDNAEAWAATLSDAVAPEDVQKQLEEEGQKAIHTLPDNQLNWAGLNDLNNASVFLARERQRDRDKWIKDAQSRAVDAPPEFYVIANIPTLKIKFDTRKRMYVHDKKRNTTVTKPQNAIWDDVNVSRRFVLRRIHHKLTGEMVDNIPEQEVKQILKEKGLTLQYHFVHVPNVHEAGKSGQTFPALIFGLHLSETLPTRYAYTEQKGLNALSDETIVLLPPEDERNMITGLQQIIAMEQTPLTFFELEDLVIKGRCDDAEAPCTLEGIEHAYISQQARGAMPVDIKDLDTGVDAYVGLCLSLDRHDLADMATDPEGQVCEMDVDVAWAIWNGEMLPPDAGAIWGDRYMSKDKNGKLVEKRGMWLRTAMDILLEHDELEVHPLLDRDQEVENMFQERIHEMIEEYGSKALNNMTSELHGQRVVWEAGTPLTIPEFVRKTDLQQLKIKLGLKAFRPHPI